MRISKLLDIVVWAGILMLFVGIALMLEAILRVMGVTLIILYFVPDSVVFSPLPTILIGVGASSLVGEKIMERSKRKQAGAAP